MKHINLAILWHMHQPPYLEPFSAGNLLPWSFLHGMKDYYDMGAVAARHPGMRMNVNFTPCLLEQLAGYASGTLADRTIAVMSKRPASMTDADREYLFRTCFGLTDRMVEPFPRFVELRTLYRSAVAGGTALPNLKTAEITDLTILYLLAWCGPTLAAREPIRTLTAKGRGFCDADRNMVLDQARQLIGATRDLYRNLMDDGIVELSTTPATHPILPLLCSTRAAVEARADVRLPMNSFDSPDEARRQVEAGLRGFEDFFGFRPSGMWPAEGSVSKQALSILSAAGLKWIATDEAILKKSLGTAPTDILHPRSFDGVSIFFRDHFLSDQIGFDYSRRPAEKAVEDFMHQMSLRAKAAKDDKALVVVALDGENAWEFYPDGGFPFLDLLYTAIEKSGFINPVTFSEYLDRFGPPAALDSLASGSWIDGNFDTWIGDPTKNLAWDYLSAAHQAITQADLDDAALEKARRHLMRAEASDWFWWFGRGHTSIHEKEFDFLFRRNLKAVYDAAEIPSPAYLDTPVGQGEKPAAVVMPTSFISPQITGRRDSYYKWVGAGVCEHSQGSIHRAQPIIRTVRFGFDADFLYIGAYRFDGVAAIVGAESTVRVVFRKGREITVLMRRGQGTRLEISAVDGNGQPVDLPGASAAAGEVLEMAIPLGVLSGSKPGRALEVSFFIEVETGNVDVERFPWDSWIDLKWDPEKFRLNNWFV